MATKTTTAAPPPPEIIEVDGLEVACDGGGGPLGHPKIYLSLEKGVAECGYCDRRFVRKPGAKAAQH